MKDRTPSKEASQGESLGIDELARIFSEVADAPKERREAILKDLCSDDGARQQIRLMLDADSSADPLLDHSLYPVPAHADVAKENIAGYTLLEELGLGGMGVVFRAEQFEPVRRTVALKVVKPGVDTREVIARFDVERQALSLMDHPNIARVLDAGSTESGRPYFVMELVHGEPITTYCEHKQLPTKERLELFISVCHAIQHAHQKGIIHRDIKPSNVLVAEFDGRPVAKVIDFGVAKAIDQPLTELTSFTQIGQIVGTFEYMSPEQSRATQLDVDTRSDIYSLGVLLYELLAGSPPFDKDRLRSVGLEEMLRIIREEDPPKPSTRLSKGTVRPADQRDSVGRQTKSARTLEGELDWIVMKAMEKDRIRRYTTPNEFAHDIECFLSGDAVAACPPSRIYRWRKFAKRNKVAFVTSALVGAALVLGMIGTTWQAILASRAEAKATEISDFLKDSLFGLAGEPETTTGFNPDPNLRMLILLKNASDEVEKRFADRPEIKADLNAMLARSFSRIGQYEDATRLYKEYLEFLKAKKGPQDPDTILVMRQLVKNYIDESRLDEAKQLCDEALRYSLELGEESELTLQLLNDLATVYYKQKSYGESLATHLKCLEIKERTLGSEHLDTLVTKTNLGLVYESIQDYEKAELLYKEVLAINEAKQDLFRDVRIAAVRSNLGRCYLKIGRDTKEAVVDKRIQQRDRFAESAKLLRASWSVYRENRGHFNPDTLEIQLNLAESHNELGQFGSAESLLTDLVDRLERLPDSDEVTQLEVMNTLGWTLMQQSRFAEAEGMLAAAYEGLRHTRPADPRTIQVMGNLAIVYDHMGKFDAAVIMDEKTLRLAESVLGPDHVEAVASKARLGLGYLEQGRTVEGRAYLEQAFAAGEQLSGAYQIAEALAKSFEGEQSYTKAQAWTTKQLESGRRYLRGDSREFAALHDECVARQLRMKSTVQVSH